MFKSIIYRVLLFPLFILAANIAAHSQSLNNLFNQVDTIFPGGAPGALNILSQDAIPIVSSTPCSTPLVHYAVVREYEKGRVVVMGHEGIVADDNITIQDNLTFLVNTITWLSADGKKIKMKNGWVNTFNTGVLQNALANKQYTMEAINSPIDQSVLAQTNILILGNDWNNQQPYSAEALTAIKDFVAEGGALFIVGLGWSWPGDLKDYPMNAVANQFGVEFTKAGIYDELYKLNDFPLFYNFYPANQQSMETPYCPSPYFGRNIARGENLRVLRLAVSTMGEFTSQQGGRAQTKVELENWLEQINTMYGREFCVRFELIPNNDQLLFTDAGSDPWNTLPPGSVGCTNANVILDDQARVIDELIGAENYDISHVIAGEPFGGGCAGGFKNGLSGGFDFPVTRHEMGHQFSQAHTINNGGSNNYEPENGGWTMHGGNRFGNAHGVSFHQLAYNLAVDHPNAGQKIPTNNTIPSVDAGPDRFIPISTPFTLKGSGSDPDAGDSLSFVWDNMSPGVAQAIPVQDDSQGALFMRLLPDTSASRTFPRMSDVIRDIDANEQEQLPTQARVMDFRLTVNDHHKMVYRGKTINASGVNSDDVRIVVANAGPFRVSSQATSGLIYTAGSEQLVNWEVNGTDLPPINTREVKISLSLDGGFTYPITLLERTPNTGTARVLIPNSSTAQGRIKVEAVDNIFFDINTTDFTIQADQTTPTVQVGTIPFAVYPSPASDILRIEPGANLNFSVRLYNTNGKLLQSTKNTTQVNIANISPGTYILELMNTDTYERLSMQIVINR